MLTMIMQQRLQWAGRFLLFSVLLNFPILTVTIPSDLHANCASWAESGECESNPNFMLPNCATSCHQLQKANSEALEKLKNIHSFYDLSAHDLQGNLISFSDFRNKVVILTNVASYCGYTASHYRSLVQLWKTVTQDYPNQVEILAFPCNQFGQQEPGTPAEIQEFAKQQGVKFRMMQKINVNGPDTSLVYLYLKQQAGPAVITWNFATYYVVAPLDGTVEAFSGVEPMDLQPRIVELQETPEEL